MEKIVLFRPPWIIGSIIIPIFFTFLNKKLRSICCYHETLNKYLSPDALPAELNGSLAFDEDGYVRDMIQSASATAPSSRYEI